MKSAYIFVLNLENWFYIWFVGEFRFAPLDVQATLLDSAKGFNQLRI